VTAGMDCGIAGSPQGREPRPDGGKSRYRGPAAPVAVAMLADQEICLRCGQGFIRVRRGSSSRQARFQRVTRRGLKIVGNRRIRLPVAQTARGKDHLAHRSVARRRTWARALESNRQEDKRLARRQGTGLRRYRSAMARSLQKKVSRGKTRTCRSGRGDLPAPHALQRTPRQSQLSRTVSREGG